MTKLYGSKTFSNAKTDNLKVSAKMLMEGGDIPVMAQVHALIARQELAIDLAI